MLKEAFLYQKLEGDAVKCNLCARRCIIPDGARGFCYVRENRKGTLYSLVYGKVIAAHVDPIEKKPLYHFHPTATVFSIATIGCNFRCSFCDNWLISQRKEIEGEDMLPEEVIRQAKATKSDGISYTYTEPTIFMEFAYDTAKLARSEGLFNTFVTNGYMTPEAVDLMSPYLDAATVDFKGSGDPHFYKKYSAVQSVEPIYEALKSMKEKKIFVEITDLIVPEVGDSPEQLRKLARWIVDNLGPETPIHLLRFHPDYMATDLRYTPTATLEKLREVAVSEGLYYVYLGNVPGHKYENTYCPSCGALLIERYGFYVSLMRIKDGKCPKCGFKVNVVL